MAENVIGLFKTEVIHNLVPWRGLDDVEWATLQWVSRWNALRLHSALGYGSLAMYERQCHGTRAVDLAAAGLK
jgi:putative transposase